jgi:hypothetical protein
MIGENALEDISDTSLEGAGFGPVLSPEKAAFARMR